MSDYTRYLIVVACGCLLAISSSLWCLNLAEPKLIPVKQLELTLTTVEPQEIPRVESVEQLIVRLSEEAGFDSKISVRIATCESMLGKYRKNWEGSSATGLFQFMPSTFYAYCEGNITNDIDQTKCFIKLYKIHPHYWVCK